MPMTLDDVRAMVLGFSGTEEGTAWGKPAPKAAVKAFDASR